MANTAPLLVASPPSVMMSVFEGGVGSATSDVTAGDGAAVGIGVADDASWLTVAPASGTTPLTLDLTADSTGLAAGTHSATVTVTDPAGIHVSTTIAVNLQVTTPGPPDQIHLSWVEDPATSFTVVWRTPLVGTPSVVEYRTAGAPTWSSSTGTVRPSGTSGMLHEATVTGLVPDTKYEYRVRGTAGSWSGVRATRTAPAPGPADFDVVFVADTGLIGRIDGLATGTAQVRDEIAALDPRLVLGGGDYAYFSTETRFATLDEAIDEWFEQWSTVIDRTPFMPTYGNHEVLLGESYQSWADRFATPDGFNGRRFYSFDIGETHFISMLAVAEQQGLSSPELEWIEDDIIAAQAAGQRWIIPFFHVAAFADGGNHPSNLQLRNQLGPLFEQYGVQLVLFAHDQSYERTYPLTDVPATNSPTSTSTVCYDAGDGAVWMKSGPGGKLSNKNADFSQWLTTPSPPWTAFRDNTRHHFSRLTFSALGSLRVETYGVTGDGGPPVIQDSFEITSGSYPGNLVATPTALEFTVSEGDGDAADITVTASDGSSVGFAATANEPWLAVTPASGPTPGTVAVSVDTAGLVPGTHTGAVAVSDPTGTFDPTTVPVQLTVIGAGPAYDLLMSSSSDRSDPASLDGAAVAGDIAVFTAPDAGVGQVRFFLDETQHRTEKNAPFDFNGGSVGAAKLYATTELDDGLHTITAELDDASGTTTVQAVFTGANTSPVLSFTPATVGFSVLEGETSADSVSLTSSSGASVGVEVTDDASWLSVAPVAGTTPMVLDLAVDTTGLVLGRHTAAVTATDPGGVHVPGTLTVTVDVVEQALRSVPSTLTFSVPEGGAAAQDVTIETTDGTGVDFGTTTSDSWLVASPVSGSTPQSVTVSVEASGLGVGTHHGSIVATDPGGIYDPVTVPVQLTVTAPTIYQLLVSGSPDRSVPTALEGATVAGDIFVFVEPTAGVGHVDFWINDPGRVSRRDKRESNPPFDLAGTAGGPARFANPYDSAQLGNGANTVSIEVNLDDGSTVVVDASFTVSNG